MKSAFCPPLTNVKRCVEETQPGSSVRCCSEADCSEEPYQAAEWTAQKSQGSFFFFFSFSLRIMPWSCSKLKVNLSIERPCSQQAGSFCFFEGALNTLCVTEQLSAQVPRSLAVPSGCVHGRGLRIWVWVWWGMSFLLVPLLSGVKCLMFLNEQTAWWFFTLLVTLGSVRS